MVVSHFLGRFFRCFFGETSFGEGAGEEEPAATTDRNSFGSKVVARASKLVTSEEEPKITLLFLKLVEDIVKIY
jgi:hypothetical protein